MLSTVFLVCSAICFAIGWAKKWEQYGWISGGLFFWILSSLA